MADSVIWQLWRLALLAQEGGGGGIAESLFGGLMLPILITLALMYFLLIMPDRKKRREMEQRLAAIKKNDHVVTIGGIHGTVVATPDPRTVVIRVDDTTGTKLKVLRSAISHIGAASEEAEGKSGARGVP